MITDGKVRFSLRLMRTSYVGSLVLLSVLSVSSFFILHNGLRGHERSLESINLIIKQRYIMQRISILAGFLLGTENEEQKEQSCAEISRLTAEYESSLVALDTQIASGVISPEDASDGVAPVPGFRSEVRRFIASSRALCSGPAAAQSAQNPHYRFIGGHTLPLAEHINFLVDGYQEAFHRKIERLQNIHLGILCLTLYAFFATGWFAFRPMSRLIKGQMDQLKSLNDSLAYQSQTTAAHNRELKQKESALLNMMEDLEEERLKLEQEVVERVRAQKTQVRLLEDLERANKDLQDFAYIVSHDLKAPLRAIGTLSHWLATDHAGQLDEEGRKHVDLIHRRVRRLNDLIDAILQYSRTSRIHEEKTEVDVNQVVKDAIELIYPLASFQIRIDGELPRVMGQKTRLMQIFQNLIGNAVKYSDKARGEIHVGAREEEDRWVFYVKDNGPGIEERHFEKIFQMFQTIAARDQRESTGVGLALVKKNVELQGGKVWVESRVGEGSVFFFTLPK